MLSVVDEDGTTGAGSLIDEIVREGARRMPAAALEAEVDQYMAELAGQRDEAGRRLVVRNGRHRPRMVTTAAGPVKVAVPRVNDKRVDAETGERKRSPRSFSRRGAGSLRRSARCCRCDICTACPSGDFVPAMEQFLGSSAGLSSSTVTRLTKQWTADHAEFQRRDLAETDYVYVWADGVHPKARLSPTHSWLLVLMGVRVDGTAELIAMAEGLRESTESWADLLRDCSHRGTDPMLVVGDGAMGLRLALAEVFPQARHQRCWVRKMRNVMNALPKSTQPGARADLQEIHNAEDRAHTENAVTAFEKAYGAKWPKATKEIMGEVDELLAFYDFPAEHWVHPRTTNPIESTFSTVKLRTKVTRGAGSPSAALAMVFKLVESAQARWRAVTAPHLVALGRDGARFENGHLMERPEGKAAWTADTKATSPPSIGDSPTTSRPCKPSPRRTKPTCWLLFCAMRTPPWPSAR
ncbi:Transposase (or an inactivated derivative) [Streptomyces sp. 2131.1]|uniref:IS256 family transposase n=1 Tax=Streptomyces sp. 2131.1 TaxID=1855346 RepID=UPI00089C1648|nr:IS256 family transposase [Streptomyces sp. 2131.1]SEE48076.1 Transposase (or an inactivated derivative) [Streptomyces sp. 2131.1]